MTKRSPLYDELDAAVNAVFAGSAVRSPVNPRLADLAPIAADLRDLPRPGFKARLAAELATGARHAAAAASNVGPVLLTFDDISARLAEIAKGPTLAPYDLQAGLTDLPELTMRFFASLDQCTIGVSRFSSGSHWERHPAGDEFLHVLEGDMEVTTLTADGPVQSRVSAGSVFVCPRGLWHQLQPLSPVSLFYATPGEGIEHAPLDKPPRPPDSTARPSSGAPQGASATTLVAHDIRSALRITPPLTISSTTTAEEADASFRPLTTFNRCTVNVGHFSGRSPWERHRGGDELLHILDGEVDLTVLTDDGPVHRTIGAGCVFVCPRGLWHRQHSRQGVTALYATPTPSDISFADDPRLDG